MSSYVDPVNPILKLSSRVCNAHCERRINRLHPCRVVKKELGNVIGRLFGGTKHSNKVAGTRPRHPTRHGHKPRAPRLVEIHGRRVKNSALQSPGEHVLGNPVAADMDRLPYYDTLGKRDVIRGEGFRYQQSSSAELGDAILRNNGDDIFFDSAGASLPQRVTLASVR